MNARKGISPIVASLLVFVVAIAMVSIYAQWAPNLARNTSERTTSDVERDIECSSAGLSISDVSYDTAKEEVILDIENTGTVRFVETIQVVAFNESVSIGRKTLEGLEVGQKQKIVFGAGKIPARIVAFTEECPSITEEQSFIRVD
ncbi:MAG: hypothetical protein ABEI58_03925 [Candidatus Nanohaloarchaea archaeon]